MAKVLIIEDSKSQAAIIAEIVRTTGHEAILCPDVSSGIAQILRATQPEIVLLDLVLLGPDGKPTADGFHICREIKRVSQAIKVVVVSAKGDDDSAEWAIMQGADAFLQKPFALEDLVAVIQKCLPASK